LPLRLELAGEFRLIVHLQQLRLLALAELVVVGTLKQIQLPLRLFL
jgi:hypothetical protein